MNKKYHINEHLYDIRKAFNQTTVRSVCIHVTALEELG